MDLDEDPSVDGSNAVPGADGPATFLTPSDRIADLNSIDTLLTTLLSSASASLLLLSNPPSNNSLSQVQSEFDTSANAYMSTLSAIETRLRRQVYALQEAGLIADGSERDVKRARELGIGAEGVYGEQQQAGGGSGVLDASWLNARVSSAVEDGKKAELLAKGREWAESEGVVSRIKIATATASPTMTITRTKDGQDGVPTQDIEMAEAEEKGD